MKAIVPTGGEAMSTHVEVEITIHDGLFNDDQSRSTMGAQTITRGRYLYEDEEIMPAITTLSEEASHQLEAALNCVIYRDDASYPVQIDLEAWTGESSDDVPITTVKTSLTAWVYPRLNDLDRQIARAFVLAMERFSAALPKEKGI